MVPLLTGATGSLTQSVADRLLGKLQCLDKYQKHAQRRAARSEVKIVSEVYGERVTDERQLTCC